MKKKRRKPVKAWCWKHDGYLLFRHIRKTKKLSIQELEKHVNLKSSNIVPVRVEIKEEE